MDLYISHKDADAVQGSESVEADLWCVWDVLMDMFKEDSTSYLEAKTWLITSIANLQHVPGRVRLQALAPYLKFAQPTQQRSKRGEGNRRGEERRGREEAEGDGGRTREKRERIGRDRRRGRSGSCESESSGEGGGRRRREQDKGDDGSDDEGRRRKRGNERSRGRSRSGSDERGRRKRRGSSSSRSSSSSSSSSPGARAKGMGYGGFDEHEFSASPSPPSSPTRQRQQHKKQQEQERKQERLAASGAPPQARMVVHQLLLLLLEERGPQVARLLARRPSLFRDFFAGSDLRIMMWFSHFSMKGMPEFKYGAHALAHYTLEHRDEAWQYLVWEGKHAQAPVSVATKTHYFCEINVLASVHNLIDYCPSFWSSEQLLNSFTRGGEVMQLDPPYFAKVFQDILSEDPAAHTDGVASRVHDLLHDFICEESWKLLSQRLLSLMTDEELLEVAANVSEAMPLKPERSAREQGATGSGSAMLQSEVQNVAGPLGWQDLSGLTLSGGPHWVSLPHLVLTHALANHRGQLLGIMRTEEELHGKLREVEQLCYKLHGFSSQPGRPPFSSYHCPAQEHQALFASLRPPAHSASSRQLVALELWTLRLALCHAAQLPANSSSGVGLGGPPTSAAASLLGATIQGLGGTCRVAHTACTTEDVRPSSTGAQKTYDMLPSSSEDGSGDGSDDEGSKRKRRKKGGKEVGGYAMLSSSDEESRGSKGGRKKSRKKGKGQKRKRGKEGKRGKHKGKGEKRKKRKAKKSSGKRRRSSSDTSSSGDSDSDRSDSDSDELGTRSVKAHSPSPRRSLSHSGSGDGDENEGGGTRNATGAPLGGEAQLYEVVLPLCMGASTRGKGGVEAPVLRVVGSVEEVADVLACAASKHWLQGALVRQ